jgi:hypothetical protein
LRGGCHDTNADRTVYAANNDRSFVGPAEEPTVITLSCDGMTKVYVKRDEGTRYPIAKMSVVVNLTERTVLFDGRVAHIDHIDTRTIFLGAIV